MPLPLTLHTDEYYATRLLMEVTIRRLNYCSFSHYYPPQVTPLLYQLLLPLHWRRPLRCRREELLMNTPMLKAMHAVTLVNWRADTLRWYVYVSCLLDTDAAFTSLLAIMLPLSCCRVTPPLILPPLITSLPSLPITRRCRWRWLRRVQTLRQTPTPIAIAEATAA